MKINQKIFIKVLASRGLSIKAAARLSGVDAQTLAAILQGKPRKLHILTISKIAKAFDVDAETLIEEG